MNEEEDIKADPQQGQGNSAKGNDAPEGAPKPGKQDGVADKSE